MVRFAFVVACLALPALVAASGCGPSNMDTRPAVPGKASASASASAVASSAPGPYDTNILAPSLTVLPPECDKIRPSAASGALYDKGCDGGDATSCQEVALYYLCGVGLTQDFRKAADRALRACEHGIMEACGNAGMMLLYLPGVTPQELERGVRATKKGCDGGNVAACNNLATAMLYGNGMTKDEAGAAAVFEKLCAKGNYPSCGNLSLMYLVGLGVPLSLDKAVAVAKPACEKGEPMSCNTMGAAYLQGYGTEPNGKLVGADYFRKACEGGHLPACDNLGQCYAGGVGVGQDSAQAERLFKLACDRGQAVACRHLAALLAQRATDGGPHPIETVMPPSQF